MKLNELLQPAGFGLMTVALIGLILNGDPFECLVLMILGLLLIKE